MTTKIIKATQMTPGRTNIPVVWKKRYAQILNQKGLNRESRREVRELYKEDFHKIFPDLQYEPMHR